jgi:hypothetical protein
LSYWYSKGWWLLVFYSSEVDIYGQMLITTDLITKN